MTTIDICTPTLNSARVLEEAINHLKTALDASPFEIATWHVHDGGSNDGTPELTESLASRNKWPLNLHVTDKNLPDARTALINQVTTEWFLFLDDDVRINKDYLKHLHGWTAAPAVGAVHGRKQSYDDLHPTDWNRIRSRRGGTHATLIRTRAVRNIDIPSDLEVLEDEYLRRWIESAGYDWVMSHEAMIRHDCKGRHPQGWTEGYLAGKYGFAPLYRTALNIPYSFIIRRNPSPYISQTLGWIWGYIHQGSAEPPTPESVPKEGSYG